MKNSPEEIEAIMKMQQNQRISQMRADKERANAILNRLFADAFKNQVVHTSTGKNLRAYE